MDKIKEEIPDLFTNILIKYKIEIKNKIENREQRIIISRWFKCLISEKKLFFNYL